MANRYWVGGSGNWSDTARWSTSSGGTGGASVPTSADDVFFDASSNTGADPFTVTVDAASTCAGFTVDAGIDGIMTLHVADPLSVYAMTLQPSVLVTDGGGYIEFAAPSGPRAFVTAGVIFGCEVRFNSTGQVQITGALTCALAVTVAQGSVSFVSAVTMTCAQIITPGSGGRSINMPAGGNFVLTGTGTVLDMFSISGTPLPGSTDFSLANETSSTRTFRPKTGAGNKIQRLFVGGVAASGITVVRSGDYGTIECAQFSTGHTIQVPTGEQVTVDRFVARGTESAGITLTRSGSPGNFNLVYAGTEPYADETDYITISRCNASPSGVWFAGEHSVDGGNNSDIAFRQSPDEFMQFCAP